MTDGILARAILAIAQDHISHFDNLVWHFKRSSLYSVKRGYWDTIRILGIGEGLNLELGKSGTGVVFRDNTGFVLAYSTWTWNGYFSPGVAGALGIYSGVLLACRLGY
ncbi:hypothetical protein F8388_026255 [Cannabis sativa]|nr:hypothetical protein F8388_026255 [Cannabis sativa]